MENAIFGVTSLGSQALIFKHEARVTSNNPFQPKYRRTMFSARAAHAVPYKS